MFNEIKNGKKMSGRELEGSDINLLKRHKIKREVLEIEQGEEQIQRKKNPFH